MDRPQQPSPPPRAHPFICVLFLRGMWYAKTFYKEISAESAYDIIRAKHIVREGARQTTKASRHNNKKRLCATSRRAHARRWSHPERHGPQIVSLTCTFFDRLSTACSETPKRRQERVCTEMLATSSPRKVGHKRGLWSRYPESCSDRKKAANRFLPAHPAWLLLVSIAH